MKPFTIKDTSYSWRFASVYGPLDNPWDRDTDICTYTKAVLKGVFVWCILLVVASGLSVAYGDALGWIAAMLAEGMFIHPAKSATIALGVTTLVGLVVLAALGADAYQQAKRKRRLSQEPEDLGFVKLAYRSFKEKYCVAVTVVAKE